ncbi:nicastrin isoform X1 [Gossypium hirsutum]|uniref:Nicastrin n=2 Tax=Gossypium hirsutum TaxID=3635 RepID=A0A1U8JBC2_GOSHI|nr:nicastrin-like isoform X1 [Gossypium hirsutum]
MALKIVFLILLFSFRFRLSLSGNGQTNSMESVPDLQKSMYMVVDGYPCVRLVNLSGEIGCSNPGRDKVVAPIIKYKNNKELGLPSAILLSMDDVHGFFSRISNDSSFASNVAGVLVESRVEIQHKLKGFSPARKFPQAEFAPYHNTTYEWNPIGSGIMWKSYNFPVFLLSESSTSTLQEIAMKNEKTEKAYTTNVAEFDVVMQTTKVGTHDSESCLKEETCLPLGGYSVWSAVPPINNSSSNQSKPIILTVASMDAASFFRDKSLGADSPISGLISLLAAVDALSHVDGLDNLNKQLVFLVFTGEAWGYLGSRRFLLELDQQSDAVRGLNSSLIQLVMEIGSTGKGFSQGNKTFFAHTQVSSDTNEALDALKLAQESLKSEGVTVSNASSSNPGIPPSSLMAFLRKNSSTSGIVLEDFDTVFANKFYHSHLDDSGEFISFLFVFLCSSFFIMLLKLANTLGIIYVAANINSSAIVAAASLVARTLYVLASDKKDSTSSALSSINVNASLVEELISCLLDCDPGLSCELVSSYITSVDTCPSHYVGVVLGEPSSTPSPNQVDDISRFVWNFLADRTSTPKGNTTVCSKDCSNNGGVCIRAETDGKGICVNSTTRYVPAYSTRLKLDSGTWKVLPPNSSDPMGMLDPVWTESNWNTIGLRVYTVQEAAYDRLVLLGGISVTVLAYLAIVLTRAYITKALKQD